MSRFDPLGAARLILLLAFATVLGALLGNVLVGFIAQVLP